MSTAPHLALKIHLHTSTGRKDEDETNVVVGREGTSNRGSKPIRAEHRTDGMSDDSKMVKELKKKDMTCISH